MSVRVFVSVFVRARACALVGAYARACACACVCVCVCVCVCEAIVQPFRHETAHIIFATGHVFLDVYAVFQSLCVVVYVLVSLASGLMSLMSLMWHNSKCCLCALVIWVIVRSQT